MAAAVQLRTIRAIETMDQGGFAEPRWYAATTKPRHEKVVAQQLSHKSVEAYLPLYEGVHAWKDRRARVQLPLFPGYIFVRIALKDRLRALEIPGLLRFIGSGGQPECLPESEIDAIRTCLSAGACVEPHQYLTAGTRVRVTAGPLSGLEGIVMRTRGQMRVILSVNLIMRSLAIDVDSCDVVPVV